MKKKSSRIKKILFKVFLIALLVSMLVVELMLLVFELPLYLKTIFWIYLIIMLALLDRICDALFLETEHTEEEYDTEQNTEHTEEECKTKVNIEELKS